MWHRSTSREGKLEYYVLQTLRNVCTLVTLVDEKGPIKINKIQINKDQPYVYLEETATSKLLKQISRFEPRLELIGTVLKDLTRQIIIYDNNNNIRKPSGFKLKNPAEWVTTEESDPFHGDIEWDVLKYISSPCAVQCRFCLHKSDPPGYYTSSSKWRGAWEEIKERINNFNPEAKTGIFSEFDYGSYEKLSHPRFFEALDLIRKKTERVITIITNGESVDEKVVKKLTKYRAVLVVLSLNSYSKEIRRKVMRDQKGRNAVNAPSILNRENMPFIISLTHWHESPMEDLEETIDYTDKFSPYFIRVNLEAYSKYHPLYGKYNLEEHWRSLVRVVRKKRAEINTPIVIQPVLYEENLYQEEIQPIIRGVITNSPAFFAGLKNGDLLLQIEGKEVKYRQTAKNVLRFLSEVTNSITIKVKRGMDEFEVKLFSIEDVYPNFSFLRNSGMSYPWGIVMPDSLCLNDVKRLQKILDEHKGENILLLTSRLVYPSLRLLINELRTDKKFDRLHITIPQNTFLGEEIIIGDLFTVEDMVDSVHKWIKRKGIRPDLVIVPSTPFTLWKKDIAGDSLLNLERKVKIPVKILRTNRIWALGG